MDRGLLLGLVLLGLVVLLALMIVGWKSRGRKQVGIPAPETAPGILGEELGTFEGLYVATTEALKPLERLVVHGLGHRAKATITVARLGIRADLQGGKPLFIPRRSILAATRATWTIDKSVEPGGLAMIVWMLGDTQVNTYFRVDRTDELVGAVIALLMEMES